MRFLSLIACLCLVGCTTTSVVEKPMVEIPPSELVAPPMPLVEIVALSDGSIDIKGALSTIVTNNVAAKHNSDQLQKLEDWLKNTQENIKKAGEKR